MEWKTTTMATKTNQIWPLQYSAKANLTHSVLQQLFKQYEGAFTIKLWDNSLVEIGHDVPAFKLGILNPSLLYDLILIHDPVRLAEAYFDGEIEVEGDFNAAMGLRYYFEHLKLPLKEKLSLALKTLTITKFKLLRSKVMNKPINPQLQNSKESIAFHYDVSNAFYQLWLDPKMLYSCAYFETPDQNLNQAQINKLNHICRKLRLKPGESFLDVGCGWGGLACWAAKYYGVSAHGITLSQNQYDYANAEIKRQGLQGQVVIEQNLQHRHV
jgi:cyclopropane-fatty-acyl-phospholipid synthase